MDLADKVAVVTGGASGIGRALCRRFADEGARGVVVVDVDGAGAQRVALSIGAIAVEADVTDEAQVRNAVRCALDAHGRVDLFCSNAGIEIPGGAEVSDEDWRAVYDVNVMAHVYGARAVLPSMIDRGEGYLLNTASAAGLLTMIGSAPYSVTKHAAVALAEWLAITHGDDGIKVSCLCPQGVKTGMLNADRGPAFLLEGALEPEEVAESVVRGLHAETFLILPHPEVLEYLRGKARDYDRWIEGMRRLRRRISDPE